MIIASLVRKDIFKLIQSTFPNLYSLDLGQRVLRDAAVALLLPSICVILDLPFSGSTSHLFPHIRKVLCEFYSLISRFSYNPP